jgi:hypothetical protein
MKETFYFDELLDLEYSNLEDIKICEEGRFANKALIISESHTLIKDSKGVKCLIDSSKKYPRTYFSENLVISYPRCAIESRTDDEYEGSLFISKLVEPIIFKDNNLRLLIFLYKYN